MHPGYRYTSEVFSTLNYSVACTEKQLANNNIKFRGLSIINLLLIQIIKRIVNKFLRMNKYQAVELDDLFTSTFHGDWRSGRLGILASKCQSLYNYI